MFALSLNGETFSSSFFIPRFIFLLYSFLFFFCIFDSKLDNELQVELKKYLVSKGIGESLTNFLLHHLHKKEQAQYVDWLHKLESYVAKSE